MKKLAIKILVFALALSSPSSSLFANVSGSDLQNFRPNSNGLDFISVYSSDTLTPGVLNVGAFVTYTTNNMPFFLQNVTTTTQKFTEPNDTLFSSDIHFGLGITKGWDFGASASYVLDQSVENSDFLGTYSKTGLVDIRVNTRVRFFKGETSGMAIVFALDSDRVGNNPYSGTEAGLNYSVELAFDKLLNEKWRWGLNVGYRLRDEGEPLLASGVTPVPDQFTYSTALSYLVKDWKSNFILELFGSNPSSEFNTPTDRKNSNLEALLGWRWNVDKKFEFHAGVGREVYHGLSTPDFRGYAGFNWRFGPLWKSGNDDSDRDGVADQSDLCPNTLSADRSRVNGEGCVDSDLDGVFNNLDQCPKSPMGAKVDGNGCQLESGPSDDDDQDGVVNFKDECPGTPQGETVNDLGCRPERVQTIALKNLYFITGTATMVKSSKGKFEEAMGQLETIRASVQKIIVEGHTDSQGREQSNLELSQHRADTIAMMVRKRLKLSSGQVEAIGYGEAKPIESNKTRSGRLANRRVELRVIQTEK